ncbi:MAG: MinD/ParA family protein [Phycisphaerales bacterium]
MSIRAGGERAESVAPPISLPPSTAQGDQASRLRALVDLLGRQSAGPGANGSVPETVTPPAAAGASTAVHPAIRVNARPHGLPIEVTSVLTERTESPVYTINVPDSDAATVHVPSGPRVPPRPEPRAALRHQARLITIASGKGGVGKTSLAVNLAIALTAKGQRVTLLDADLGTANADLLCGLNPAARIEHVLGRGDRSLADIALAAPGGFKLVPGSVGLGRMADLGEDDRRRLVRAIADLETTADVVFVDAAAGIGSLVTTFVNAADLTLVVATPEPTSIADAYALIKASCAERPARGANFALVVNQAQSEAEANTVHTRISGVCRKFLGLSLPLAGWIAQDQHVAQSVRARRPLMLRSPHCASAVAVSRLATTLAKHFRLSPAASIAPASEPGALQRLSLWLAHFAS